MTILQSLKISISPHMHSVSSCKHVWICKQRCCYYAQGYGNNEIGNKADLYSNNGTMPKNFISSYWWNISRVPVHTVLILSARSFIHMIPPCQMNLLIFATNVIMSAFALLRLSFTPFLGASLSSMYCTTASELQHHRCMVRVTAGHRVWFNHSSWRC